MFFNVFDKTCCDEPQICDLTPETPAAGGMEQFHHFLECFYQPHSLCDSNFAPRKTNTGRRRSHAPDGTVSNPSKQKNMNKLIITAAIVATAFPSAASKTTIWYPQPAREWMEASPIGNGRLSGMVFGGIRTDRISLNEISMWSGQYDPTSNDLCGAEGLAQMREAFFNNNPEEGNRLGEQYLTGRMTSFGTHLPIGDLVIDMKTPADDLHGYTRTLDLEEGSVKVRYLNGDTEYSREYIASWPAQVMAVRLTSSKPAGISLSLGLDLLQKAEAEATDSTLTFSGKAALEMHGPGGVAFCGAIRIVPEGGTISTTDGTLSLENADAATIIIDVRTDYNNSDFISTCNDNVGKAARTAWNTLKKEHTADYAGLFGRMKINLGESRKTDLPTDTRLHLAQEGAPDPGLDALFFQYGRYMLISSSRSNGTPLCANLQGIWNDNRACNMPWTCDYHLDINIAQNYWSAKRANLAECNEPLFNYIGFLAGHGKETVRKMYGCGGWVAHTVCNAWGYTAPGWGVSWGMNVTGGAWLATHIWSHYLYTRDDFLRQTGYPLLRQTAEFFRDYMVEDPRTGYLATGPSISPENGYVAPSGSHLSLSMMPAIDRQIVYDIYNACIESSKILGVDHDELLPHIKKYEDFRTDVHSGMGINNMWNSGKNIPFLRYANVLLLYAECLNELGQTADAVEYVNQVRRRAWDNNLPDDKAWKANMSKEQFFEALMTERVRELFGERWRKFDLVRTGKFVEYVKARNKWTNRYGKIQEYNKYWPIPQSEIDQNDDITPDDQNEGYR